MNHASLLALTHNAALLLAMLFVYDMASSRWRSGQPVSRRMASLQSVPVGLALGLIGVVIMLTPWQFQPGIVFDTRSVLLAISGLFFGAIPTVIAMGMTAALRYSQGGRRHGLEWPSSSPRERWASLGGIPCAAL
mgnify:CR=1 FL=1